MCASPQYYQPPVQACAPRVRTRFSGPCTLNGWHATEAMAEVMELDGGGSGGGGSGGARGGSGGGGQHAESWYLSSDSDNDDIYNDSQSDPAGTPAVLPTTVPACKYQDLRPCVKETSPMLPCCCALSPCCSPIAQLTILHTARSVSVSV